MHTKLLSSRFVYNVHRAEPKAIVSQAFIKALLCPIHVQRMLLKPEKCWYIAHVFIGKC